MIKMLEFNLSQYLYLGSFNHGTTCRNYWGTCQSEAIWDSIGYVILWYGIGLKTSRRDPSKSDNKLKPRAAWSPVWVRVLVWRSDRPHVIFLFVLIGYHDHWGFDWWLPIESYSNSLTLAELWFVFYYQ